MKYFLQTICLTLGLWACSSSHITSSWKAENARAKSYKKIMVMGLIGDLDSSIRIKMEEHLAGDLKDLGYNAVTAVDEYGPKAFENLGEQEALKQLNTKNIDAVITVVFLDKTKEVYYVRGAPRNYYYSDYRNSFWRYYNSVYGRVYSPGYYSVSTKYFWESNFYDMENGRLVYSAQSHSFDPSSPGRLGHEYGLMIAKDLVKKQVLIQRVDPPQKAF